jgi:hypothetical protein
LWSTDAPMGPRVAATLRNITISGSTSHAQMDSCCPEAAQCGAPARAPSHQPDLPCLTPQRVSGFSRTRCRDQDRRHACRSRSGRCSPEYPAAGHPPVRDFQVAPPESTGFAGDHGHRVVAPKLIHLAGWRPGHARDSLQSVRRRHDPAGIGGLGPVALAHAAYHRASPGAGWLELPAPAPGAAGSADR